MSSETVDKYTDKNARLPFIDPLILILKSRRFMTAAVGVIVFVFIQQVPQLAPFVEQLGTLLAVLFSIVVGGYSIEDAVTAWSKVQADNMKKELPRLFGELAREAIETALQDAVKEASVHLDNQERAEMGKTATNG